jgi:predicted PurR-regulated permease PerM
MQIAPEMIDDIRVGPDRVEGHRRFVRRVAIVVGLVALVAISLVVFGLAWTTTLTLFGGMLIGVILDGVAQRIAKWTHAPRTLVVILLLLVMLGATVGAGFWLGPAIADRVAGLSEQVSAAWSDIRTWLAGRPWGESILEDLSTLEVTSVMTPRFGGLLSTTVGSIASLLLVAVFGIYFALDPKSYICGFAQLFHPHQRGRVLELFAAIGRALRSWFVGRFLSMVVVGIGTGIGLWLVGVPLALPLGILAGVLSFVPNVGPILSAVPGVLIGFSIDPKTALWALLVYVGVQVLETYAINPVIQQRVVSMPPALLLAFQILMGLSGGMIGLFMATPMLVTIVVIVQSVYLRDTLGDDVHLIGAPHHHEPAETNHQECA